MPNLPALRAPQNPGARHGEKPQAWPWDLGYRTMTARTLRQILETQAKFYHTAMPGTAFSRMEDAILACGSEWTGRPLPPRMKRKTPKLCFYNSRVAAARSNRFIYCEGYAMRAGFGFPFHHAWNLLHGEVCDFTAERPEELLYLGRAFSADEIKTYSVPDSQSLFDTGRGLNLPLLKALAPQVFGEAT
jgi:hypothetical protein